MKWVIAMAICIGIGSWLGKQLHKWEHDRCPGKNRCPFDICTKHGLYGCPVSPNGIFLTDEEREQLKKR